MHIDTILPDGRTAGFSRPLATRNRRVDPFDVLGEHHRLESNQRLDLRRVASCPLDYGGEVPLPGVEPGQVRFEASPPRPAGRAEPEWDAIPTKAVVISNSLATLARRGADSRS